MPMVNRKTVPSIMAKKKVAVMTKAASRGGTVLVFWFGWLVGGWFSMVVVSVWFFCGWG